MDLNHIATQSLVTACLAVMWKVDFVNSEFGYLAGEIFKQSAKRTDWFLLAAYSKIQKGKRNSDLMIKKYLACSDYRH